MHVVVCTVVHHPADARIFYREIQALLDAGHDVTYIAPHGESAAAVRDESQGQSQDQAELRTEGGVPCASSPFPARPAGAGRARCAPRRTAMAEQAAGADLLLVHDPELLLVLPPKGKRPPTVWDVHEDTAAALTTKAWLPDWLRPVAAGAGQAGRAAGRAQPAPDPGRARLQRPLRGRAPGGTQHDVRPGQRRPRPSGPRRVVYVGWISPDRGSAEMVELGRLLQPHGIAVELIGQADAAARAHIEAGGDAVHWHGFVPNADALRLVEGALAGLSLLRDEENFRHSMPTKVAEYMGRGVPVVTTPLPLAVELVEAGDVRLRRPVQ